MSEKQFREQVIDLARWLGWRLYFTWQSIHSPAGFPDLVLVRRGRLIFVELKSEKGRLTPEQALWLKELKQIPGIEVYTWRPGDFNEVARVLRREAATGAPIVRLRGKCARRIGQE